MIMLERQNEIFNYLQKHKYGSVSELAQKFFIGEATIRRDLKKLEKQKLIERTYGGAVLIEGLSGEIPIDVREKERNSAKDFIAREAAKYISDNDVIIIDSSTTSASIIHYIEDRKNLVVITNGAKVAIELSKQPEVTVYCTGGRQRSNSLSFVGAQAEKSIKSYTSQKLFFSCRALHTEYGVQDSSVEEAELRKVMMERSTESFLLCDSSKLDGKAFYNICDLSSIDYLITEKDPGDLWKQLCDEKGVTLIYPSNGVR